jgi:hypothetical protein
VGWTPSRPIRWMFDSTGAVQPAPQTGRGSHAEPVIARTRPRELASSPGSPVRAPPGRRD